MNTNTKEHGTTGPRGLRLADYERPVFDGPRGGSVPKKRPAPMTPPLNTENAGE